MTDLFKRRTFVSPSQPRRFARRALRSTSPSVLRCWSDPGVSFALWQRQWNAKLSRQIDELQCDELPRASFIARARAAEVDVSAALAGSECRDEDVLSALITDIESLVSRFSMATGVADVEVHLSTAHAIGCLHLQSDRTRPCLITTYRGPAIEWVWPSEPAAERSNRQCVSGVFAQMPRFAVGLFPRAVELKNPPLDRAPSKREEAGSRLFLTIMERLNDSGLHARH